MLSSTIPHQQNSDSAHQPDMKMLPNKWYQNHQPPLLVISIDYCSLLLANDSCYKNYQPFQTTNKPLSTIANHINHQQHHQLPTLKSSIITSTSSTNSRNKLCGERPKLRRCHEESTHMQSLDPSAFEFAKM